MTTFQTLFWFLKTYLMSSDQKDFEIIALRSQLEVVQQNIINNKMPKPRCNNTFRCLWVLLPKLLPNWKLALVIIKPDIVIDWHKTAFRLYWKRKSRGGRPKISSTIALIKRIHKENLLLSSEKIHERPVVLSIVDAPTQ